ncbi:MAG: tetratricopeptide repeat protein [Planctomycetota bacterium]
MNESAKFEELSNEQMKMVDAHCMAFEQALRGNDAITIEQVLESVSKALNAPVCVELLAIELEWKNAQSLEIDVEDYLVRFPYRHAEIHELVDSIRHHAIHPRVSSSKTNRSVQHLKIGAPKSGSIIDERYTILEPIGEGGMGTVFLAEQHTPVNRKVAIKFIKCGMDSNAVLARFDIERRALAMMDHPGIAKVFDGGQTEDGSPYFVMELVRGVPITEYCDKHCLDVATRLKLFVSICKAVQHAHFKGIIHRDLKPGNILVSEVDSESVVKIIDFGVAKAFNQKLTEKSLAATNMIVGTPSYMSPEQAELSSAEIDTRTDVYSLGVILFELLVGTPPHDTSELSRGSVFDFLRKIREVDSPRPSTKLNTAAKLKKVAADRRIDPEKLASLLRGELDWIALKALEKDRSRRYETVNSFARDVERYLAGEVVEARPPSNAYRLRKFFSRNKGMVIAASLLFLTMTAGIIGTGWGMLRAQANAEAARLETIKKEAARQNEAREREFAEAIADFVEKDFLVLTTLTGRMENDTDDSSIDKDSTLRDLLDRAAEKLNTRSDLDPRIEGRLRAIIGASYRQLGSFENAIVSFERAVELNTTVYGTDHLDSLNAKDGLADALQQNGKHLLARPMLTETIDKKKALLGPDHDATLKTMSLLAINYRRAGEPAKAVPILEEVLALTKARYGEKGSPTLVQMHQLALGLISSDKSREALPLLERTMEFQLETLDENHPDVQVCRMDLGGLYFSSGQHRKARPLLEKGLQWSIATYGPQDHRTLYARSGLTQLYCFLREFELALPMAKETLELTKNVFGDDHRNVGNAMRDLARTYRSGGEHAKALPWFEKVLTQNKTILGDRHPSTLSAMGNVAACLRSVGEIDQAQKMNEKCLILAKDILGDDHSHTNNIKAGLAAGFWSQKRLDRSVPLFEELLAYQESRNGRKHPRTLMVIANLGVNYKDAGRLEEAVPLLEEAYRAIPDMPALGFSGPALLEGYLKSDQTEQALKLLDELVVDARNKLPAGSLKLSISLSRLGRYLLENDLLTKAEPLLKESVEIQMELAPETWSTYATIALLGKALVQQKKYAEGHNILVLAAEGMKRDSATAPANLAGRHVEVVEQLINVARALNRPNDVKKWEAELAELRADRE